MPGTDEAVCWKGHKGTGNKERWGSREGVMISEEEVEEVTGRQGCEGRARFAKERSTCPSEFSIAD